MISNIGANNVTVENSSAVSLAVLTPGKSTMIVADTNIASTWNVVYDTTSYGGGGGSTLQSAYTASGATNPQITLSNVFGALKIRDSATPASALLTLANNGGTFNYLNVSNGTAGTQTPIVSMFNGSASGAGTQNVLIVGPVTVPASNANGVILADGTAFTMDNCTSSLQTSFANGQNHYGGIVRAATGVAKTSANERMLWISTNAVPTTGATIFTTTLIANTSYRLEARILGRDTVAASSVSVYHELSAMVTLLAGVSTVYGNILQTIETPGYNVTFSTATFTSAATTLTLTSNAPDNVNGGAAGTMDFRGYVKLTALVE